MTTQEREDDLGASAPRGPAAPAPGTGLPPDPAPAPPIAQAPHVPDRRLTVAAPDGARLAVYVDGDRDAELTVLLAHGWTLTAAGWGAHIAALTDPASGRPPLRVLSFDQRGHGWSERGSAPIAVPTFAADLAAVLEQLCADRPVIVVGHSLGGMALLSCADCRSDLFTTDPAASSEPTGAGAPVGGRPRIAGAVLVSASAGAPAPQGLRGRLEAAAVEALIRYPWLGWAAHRVLTGPAAHPRTLPLWRLAVGGGPDAELARRSAEDFRGTPVAEIAAYYRAFGAHDCAGRLSALARVPVEVLVGAEDRFASPAESAAIAAELPGARLNVVPGYGHDLPYDRPDLVVAAVDAVLARRRERAGACGAGACGAGASGAGASGTGADGAGSAPA